MKDDSEDKRDLKQACITQALLIIEEKGIENLSMRDVARRLRVSHQAPYKHFAGKDQIVAAVIARIFDEFGDHLSGATPHSTNPLDDLHHMGKAYLEYARDNPLKYRLMFNTALPPVHEHRDMMARAQAAFALLESRLAEAKSVLDNGAGIDEPRLDAMFFWSTLHGFASIIQSDTVATLNMTDREIAAAANQIFKRMRRAMEAGQKSTGD